ncbi:membrane protein [Cohnella xylanilytica]|uniref:FTR1 family protein n=1 Tax=Cohnella xylanilytica TaxID=557555 RepID=A0A841U023_9BACL|nr:FTR1 family protein [Cohnella xylanilytica]MBB6691713.1 FTR1 family protein [Cohnella xylanilytica]GIO12786.1 membrane protein [Cohnella xylanilytica]
MNMQAFLITFREAMEAILIVGVILTYIRKIGETRWNKWVWTGVGLAIAASYGVALLFQVALSGYESMSNQNYLRIGIMLISTGLLTHMILFMGKQNRAYQQSVESKVATILTAGGVLNMIVHSFLVTLREGVETVFFFAAIGGGDIQSALASWGALLGVVCAGVLGFVMFKGAKRVPIGKFFKATSVFLMLISAGLLVQAVGMLQDLGILGSVYRTAGGQIGEVYNIVAFMPEHPNDEMHYIRDTGHHPLINGQVGVFFKAFLGYSHNPSVEEVVAYWGYLFLLFIGLSRRNQGGAVRTDRAADSGAAAEGARVAGGGPGQRQGA